MKLNKSIYSEKCILKAINDYSGLAKISISSINNYFICSFSECKYNEIITKKEFENHIIDIMNQLKVSK